MRNTATERAHSAMPENVNSAQDPTTTVVDVEATVDVSGNHVPPRLTFSFPGLHDPVYLWRDLAALGWHIPERPPAPAPVINWDTVDYAPPPYRVQGFVVTARPWNPREVTDTSLATINTLRRYGVELNIPISYLDFLRRAQMSVSQAPAVPRSTEPQPITIPNTIFLSQKPWAILFDEPSIDVFETAVAPEAAEWAWSESPLQPGELGSGEEERRALIESVDFGWELESRTTATPTALDGRDRTLRFLCQDLDAGTNMFGELRNHSDDQCAALLMRPIRSTPARENCLLIVAVIPSAEFAEIGYRMITQFPDAIARGKHAISTGLMRPADAA